MNEVKTSILLVMTNMNTGGIATAIRNMIYVLPKDLYSIDLLLFNNDNSSSLSDVCSVFSAGKYMRLVSINQSRANKENAVLGIYRLILGGITTVFGHGMAYKSLLWHTSSLDKEYDVAISCTQSGPNKSLYGGCNEYVLSKVNAKKKIAFIHCDYQKYGLDSAYSHKIYKQFDRIACVSDSVRKGFIECEPELAPKTVVSTNFQNFERIRQLANDSAVDYAKGVFHFATVARWGSEKGHVRMLPIISNLKKKGYSFVWHIIGGDLSNAPQEFVQEYNKYPLAEVIEFHGNQTNPYRFMINLDLLLIPSYHEAAPMVYEESHCLGVPILTTKTLSAVELVQNVGIGIVCDNNDIAIENALEQIMRNPESIHRYKSDCEASNNKAFEEFLTLINE